MKKILTTAFIAGAIIGVSIFLVIRKSPEEEAIDDVANAAKDAFNTMDKHVNRVENITERILGDA